MPVYDLHTRPTRERMHKIRENLWIGNMKSPSLAVDVFAGRAQVADMKQNITAILNVAYELDDGDIPPEFIRTVKIALRDDGSNKDYMTKLAVQTLRTMLEAGECVLIHCIAGRSRSPHIAALCLSEMEGKSYEKIYSEIREKRPEVLEQSLLNEFPNS